MSKLHDKINDHYAVHGNNLIEIDHNLKPLDAENIKNAKIIRTDDGYTFFKQLDGSWKDWPSDDFDMMFSNNKQILDLIAEGEMIFYYFKDIQKWFDKYCKDQSDDFLSALNNWQKAMHISIIGLS